TAFLLIMTSSTTTLAELMQFKSISQGSGLTPDQALAEARRLLCQDFHPKKSLRALDIPGLWLVAGADTMVPHQATMRNIDSLRRIGKPYEYRVIPGAWH